VAFAKRDLRLLDGNPSLALEPLGPRGGHLSLATREAPAPWVRVADACR
jgi:hypothetical protein